MRTRAALAFALCLVGGGSPSVLRADPKLPRPFEASEPGCWAVEDGCVGRTGRAYTRSIRGEVELAWSWQVPKEIGGRIEEEPRVWHERVYVCVRAANGDRVLFALGTHDGQPLLPALRFETPQPLDPCVGEHGALLRSGADEIRVVAVVDGRWATTWGPVGGAGTLSSPLLWQGTVVAKSQDGLRAWEFPSLDVAWQEEGRVQGRPAMDATHVYSVLYDKAGNARLQANQLASGASLTRGHLGHHGDSAPSGAPGARIVVKTSATLVQHAVPVVSGQGRSWTSILRNRASTSDLWNWAAPPAALFDSWLGYTLEDNGSALRLAGEKPDGSMSMLKLADAAEQTGFYRPEVPVTVVGMTAWIGTRAFDVTSQDVVCRLPEERTLLRPVPAHGLMLVCPEADRLHAWREESAAPQAPVFLGAAHDGTAPRLASATDGRILFRGDSVYAGPYDLDPAGTLTLRPAKGKASTRPLADALVAASGADGLLYTASVAWTDRYLERLGFLAGRSAVVEWLKEAQRAQDVRKVERLLERARSVGMIEKDLTAAHRFLDAELSTPRKVDEKRTTKLDQTMLTHERGREAAVLATLAGAVADPRPAVRREFLRHVLDRDPAHAGAVAAVRASLPPHVVVPEPFVARDWLDARQALASIVTRKVEVPAEGSRKLTPGERELGSARAYWRKDLGAFETDQLLIMTSLKEPDRLARCLGLGELVCTALEDVCKGGQHVRSNRWPLILQLFETEAEYRGFASGSTEPQGVQEWSAGHYDPSAGVSRIYVPAGDEAFASVMRTYAHELTHHWLQERCPLFEARDAATAGPALNWIVEGMAELVESFRWNLDERSWQTFNPQADDLGALAGAPPRKDWSAFFDVTQPQFERLDRTPRHKVALTSTLGRTSTLSDLNLFYATAGSVCIHLYHAGAREREALLAYVRDAYTGKLRPGTAHIQERFGLTPDQLGVAAQAWARRVVEGQLTRKQVFLR